MDGVLVPLFFFSFVSMKNVELVIWMHGTCVLDEHCDISVICMDETVFLMYVCCHGWSYVLDTSYVCCACEKIYMYICV